MDPFSITVGVSSLLALAAKTIEIANRYCHEARHAREAARELLVELDVLHYNLSQLDKLFKTEPKGISTNTSVLITSTHACRNKLNMLHDKLERTAEHPLRRIRWPLDETEHKQSLRELRAFAQWIQFALTIDGCSLLAKTSTEVVDVLTNQLHMFQMLNQVHTTADLTYHTVLDIQNTVHASTTVQQREDILNWISNAKPSQKHHAMRLPRVEGTGGWLLEEPRFKNWCNGEDDVLWCHGIQGTGKSILAAVAHVYFDYRDQEHQSLEEITASLLKQIAGAFLIIPSVVVGLHNKSKKQQRSPSQHDLEQTLITTCRELGTVYIVIDALDECNPIYVKGLLRLVNEIRDYAKIFITSRPYPEDLRKHFEKSPRIEIKAHRADLEKYLDQQIKQSDICDEMDDTLQAEIVGRIIVSAQNM
ncbi:MAG: hypothetical protein Q9213_002589 [Squamulea squamosa]